MKLSGYWYHRQGFLPTQTTAPNPSGLLSSSSKVSYIEEKSVVLIYSKDAECNGNFWADWICGTSTQVFPRENAIHHSGPCSQRGPKGYDTVGYEIGVLAHFGGPACRDTETVQKVAACFMAAISCPGQLRPAPELAWGLFYFIFFSPFSLKNRLACEFCIDQSEREWVKWGKEKEKKKEETKRAGDDVAGSIIGGSRAAHCASDGQGPPWNRAGAVVSDETLSFRNWPSGRQTTGQTNKQQRLVVRIRNQ